MSAEPEQQLLEPVTRYDSSWFPGEKFLTDNITLPDFGRERQLIIYKIIITVFLFVVVLPVLFASKQVELVEQSSSSTDCDDASAVASSAAKRGAKKRAKSKRVNGKKAVQTGVSSLPEEATTTTVINPII